MVHLPAKWQPLVSEGKRMELGRQIKRYRTERGFSQDDLAAKIYVSRQTISSWENDKTYPDVESLLLLSVLFDVTVDELIKGDVEAMKQTISEDAKRMHRFAWVMLVFLVAGIIATIYGMERWGLAGVIPGAVLLILAIVTSFAIERIKRRNDVYTYREILAFEKGEPIERNPQAAERSRRPYRRVLKFVICMVGGALFGWFGAMLVSLLIG